MYFNSYIQRHMAALFTPHAKNLNLKPSLRGPRIPPPPPSYSLPRSVWNWVCVSGIWMRREWRGESRSRVYGCGKWSQMKWQAFAWERLGVSLHHFLCWHSKCWIVVWTQLERSYAAISREEQELWPCYQCGIHSCNENTFLLATGSSTIP